MAPLHCHPKVILVECSQQWYGLAYTYSVSGMAISSERADRAWTDTPVQSSTPHIRFRFDQHNTWKSPRLRRARYRGYYSVLDEFKMDQQGMYTPCRLWGHIHICIYICSDLTTLLQNKISLSHSHSGARISQWILLVHTLAKLLLNF